MTTPRETLDRFNREHKAPEVKAGSKSRKYHGIEVVDHVVGLEKEQDSWVDAQNARTDALVALSEDKDAFKENS